jgi:hypothetical protein
MNKPFSSSTSETDWKRVTAMSDEDIDLSDIPETTAEQLSQAIFRLGRVPIEHQQASVQSVINRSVLDCFDIPPATLAQYHSLIAKRQAETLTSDEHQELINLNTQIETLNVQRIQALIQLADRRNQSLPDLMESLGINPNPEVVEYV